MKKIFLIIAFGFAQIVNAQLFSKNVKIFEKDSLVLFLDTASVKLQNETVSFRMHSKITDSKNLGNEFKKYFVRQYLMNFSNNKFFIVGEIEYNPKWKIVSSKSQKNTSEIFSKSIYTDSTAKISAEFLNSHFNRKLFSIESETKKHSLLVKDNEDSSAAQTDSAESDLVVKHQVAYEKEKEEIAEALKDTIVAAEGYFFANETNVTQTIYTDGKLYSVQISSWKNKEVAYSESEKMLRKGYNSFIVEATPPNKKGIWYRVRIGFYSSLEEAKEIEKKIAR